MKYIGYTLTGVFLFSAGYIIGNTNRDKKNSVDFQGLEKTGNPAGAPVHAGDNLALGGGSLAGEISRRYPVLYREAQTVNEGALLKKMFGDIARKDPVYAASLVERSDESIKSFLTEVLINSWVTTDAKSAYQWVRGQKDEIEDASYEYYLETALSSLADQDPEYLWKHLDVIAGDGEKELLINRLAESWSKKDPAAAFEWLVDLSQSDVSSSTITNSYRIAMLEYMKTNVEQAAQAIKGLASEELQMELVESATQHLAELDLNNAINWLDGLTSKAVREAGIEQLISLGGEENSEVILDYLLQSSKNSEESFGLLSSAFSAASRDNPSLAVRKFDASSPSVQAVAISPIVSNWLISDESKALDWLDANSPGPVKDEGIASTAYHFINKDPATSMKWAMQITDSPRRAQLLEELIDTSGENKLTEVYEAIISDPVIRNEYSVLVDKLERRIQNDFSDLVLPELP